MLHYFQRSNLPQNLNMFSFHIIRTAQNTFCVKNILEPRLNRLKARSLKMWPMVWAEGKSSILRPQNTSEGHSVRLCGVSQQCHSTGDGRSLVEVRQESGKMLHFQRIGVSLAFLASVLAGSMAKRVEIEPPIVVLLRL